MASIQAHLVVWLIKWRVKRRLKGVRNYHVARRILRPDPYRVPKGVRITAARVGGVSGEWVEGPESSGITLMYLHGGGYFGCSAESHRPVTTSFALHGFRVFAPEYRLAPENRFPAAVEEATAAYRGLLAVGIQPQRVVVSGDSAGGGLTLSLLLTLRTAATPLRQRRYCSRRGPIWPRPASRSGPMPSGVPCSTVRTSPRPRGGISATPIRAIRWPRLSTPASRACHPPDPRWR